jgi:hypothetical protein
MNTQVIAIEGLQLSEQNIFVSSDALFMSCAAPASAGVFYAISSFCNQSVMLIGDACGRFSTPLP